MASQLASAQTASAIATGGRHRLHYRGQPLSPAALSVAEAPRAGRTMFWRGVVFDGALLDAAAVPTAGRQQFYRGVVFSGSPRPARRATSPAVRGGGPRRPSSRLPAPRRGHRPPPRRQRRRRAPREARCARPRRAGRSLGRGPRPPGPGRGAIGRHPAAHGAHEAGGVGVRPAPAQPSTVRMAPQSRRDGARRVRIRTASRTPTPRRGSSQDFRATKPGESIGGTG